MGVKMDEQEFRAMQAELADLRKRVEALEKVTKTAPNPLVPKGLTPAPGLNSVFGGRK